MRAVVMAGGSGTRLRPLTTNLPKPLLPLLHRPLMDYVLRWLRTQGLTDTVVTLQYLGEMVRQYFGDGVDLGMSLRYVTEETPLGTAGSVKHAQRMLAGEPFVVVSGDALTDIDLAEVVAFHRDRGALATIVLKRMPNPLEFGIVVTAEDGRVVRFLEKPSWGQVFSDTVNTGIYVMEPEILDRVATGRPTDWAQQVFPALLRVGAPVYGFVAAGYWEDVGSHRSYQRAVADLLDRKVRAEIDGYEVSPRVWVAQGAEVHREARVTGPAYIGTYARVEQDAELREYTVLGANVLVKSGAFLHRVVAHENCFVGPHANLRGCVLGRNTSVLRGAVVEEGAVVGESCFVGEGAFVGQDVRVFPFKTIEAGSVVTSSVIWEDRGGRALFGPRGVSGIVNVELTPETVTRIATAYGAVLGPGKVVVVGRDVSRAARSLKRVVVGALTASGVGVRDVEVSPEPVIRFVTAGAPDGGIHLRVASDDPDTLEMVFLDDRGQDLSEDTRRRIERAYGRGEFRRVPPSDIADLGFEARRFDVYTQALLGAVDLSGVGDAPLKVVVDASGGTSSLVLPVLLGAVPADVLTVDLRLDERSPSESLADRMRALQRLGDLVAGSGAAFGARLDPLGRRLTLVDDTGALVPDDRALLVLTDLVAAERRHGTVCLPVTTTRVAEQVARYHSVGIRWTSTSPHDLAAAAADPGVIFAGDGAGGFVVPEFTPYADGIATLLRLLGLVARTRLRLSQIDARIPTTTTVRRAVPTPLDRRGAVMRTVLAASEGLVRDTTDGVRLLLDERSTVLVLPAATETVTHVAVEGPDMTAASTLLEHWTGVVESAVGGP